MGSSLLIGVVTGLVVALFMYLPGPGRKLRHWAMYQNGKKAFRNGQAVVALRVVAGSQVGLSSGWYRGTAVASPGQLHFTRHVGGFPLVKRPVPPVQLIAIGDVGRPRFSDSVRLDPDSAVVPLRTPTGMLQLAILPPLPAEQVLARLRWPGAPYC